MFRNPPGEAMHSSSPSHELTFMIMQHAQTLGFCAAGCAPLAPMNEADEKLDSMIREQRHASMLYLERQRDTRRNAAELLPGARTILCAALPYHQPQKAQPASSISQYALIPDYHKVVRDKLQQLLEFIRTRHHGTVNAIIAVDSAPLFEKAWAATAGLGRTGKNTLCIIPGHGSYIFLGEILLDIDLDCQPKRLPDPCHECDRCIRACPTGAITAPGTIDARRCISYLTVEHKDEFTPEEEIMVGTHLFGCDICQEVCPHNQQTRPDSSQAFPILEHLLGITPEEILTLSRSQFKTLFARTPIYRTGLKRLKRNARTVLKNRVIGDW